MVWLSPRLSRSSFQTCSTFVMTAILSGEEFLLQLSRFNSSLRILYWLSVLCLEGLTVALQLSVRDAQSF